MGDNGEILTFQLRQCEDTAYSSKFLTRVATYNTRLTEKGLNGRVGRGDGTRMRRGGTRAALTRASLDGCDATSLPNEVACMEE